MDVKFNSHLAFIYYSRTEIARHQILPGHMANSMRTEQTDLPFSFRKDLPVDALRERARETGPKTFEVIRRMFDGAKVKEQPMQTAGAILSIADIYSPEILEKACGQYHMPYYKTIYSNAKSINSAKELTEFKENNKKSGIVRGADYYRKGETTNEYRNKREFTGIGIKRPCKDHRNAGKRYKACGSKLRKASGTAP